MTTATATGCPAWCDHHLNDDYPDAGPLGTIHQRRIRVGDATLTLQETTGYLLGCDPVGPVVTDVDFEWISEGTIRDYAAALSQVADLIGIPA